MGIVLKERIMDQKTWHFLEVICGSVEDALRRDIKEEMNLDAQI